MRRNLMMMCGSVWVLAGCFEGADGPGFSTATSTLSPSEDGRRIYVASAEDDAVVLVDHEARRSHRVFEGGGPTRIAQAADRVLFTLSTDDGVVVATDSEEGLSDIAMLEINAPFGVLIEPSGERAYVSSPAAGRVEEIDPVQKTIVRSFEVEGEPTWLAIHPGAGMLYVAEASGGIWASIDLASERVTEHEVPAWTTQRYVVTTGSVVAHEYELVPRLTGDPAVTPDGGALLLPAIYEPRIVGESETASAAMLVQTEPALIVVPLGTDGAPLTGRVRVTSTRTYLLAGLPAVPGSLPLAHGWPSSVAVAPGSSYALVTHEPLLPGSPNIVVAVPIREAATRVSALTGGGDEPDATPGEYNAGTLAIPGARPGLSTDVDGSPIPLPLAIQADHGLRGVRFSETGAAWIHAGHARSVSRLDTSPIESALYDTDFSARRRALRSIVLDPPIGL